tara:strand:- start:846 stop:1127 length:282 start_codon:yes stop_codon:yes gene_type:complete
MNLFHPGKSLNSQAQMAVFARYELLRTLVDFAAALLFVVGSALFFFPSTTFAATWMFLVGSLCFAAKPTIKLLRELKLAQLNNSVPQDEPPAD